MSRAHPGAGFLDKRARFAPVPAWTHAEPLRFGLATEAEAIRIYREADQYFESDDGKKRAHFACSRDDEVNHFHALERAL